VPGTPVFNLSTSTPYTVTLAGTNYSDGPVTIQNNNLILDPTAQVDLAATQLNITASAGQSSSLTFNGAQNGSSQSQLYILGGPNGSGYLTVGGDAGTTYFTVNNAQVRAEYLLDELSAGYNFEAGSVVAINNSTFGGDDSTGLLVGGTANFNNTTLALTRITIIGSGPGGAILNLSNGSYITGIYPQSINIGASGFSTGTGTLIVNGTASINLSTEGLINVGASGGVGTVDATNGAVIDAYNINVGGSGIGTINMSSGFIRAYVSLTLGNNGTLIDNSGPNVFNYEQGNLNMSSGATFDFIISNSSSSTISIFGAATLAGTLDVTLANDFDLTPGETFQPLSFGSESGTFGSINLPPLEPGLGWNTQQLYTNGTISVVAVPEPATVGVLMMFTATTLARRRKRASIMANLF
jgi:fibronectin-binding autotransporter adhesin